VERLFGAEQGEALLARYHEIEPRVQRAQPEARELPDLRGLADVLDELVA
jgi:hypothetical protein